MSYEGMNVGVVGTSDSYTVNVRGAIPSGKVVNVGATATGSLVTDDMSAGDDSTISFGTTQGKSVWSATDAFGTLNSDGSITGTNATDNVAMSGLVKSKGV